MAAKDVKFGDSARQRMLKGVNLLADAVKNANFPEDEWRREREVVLREVSMGRDDPDRVISERLWQASSIGDDRIIRSPVPTPSTSNGPCTLIRLERLVQTLPVAGHGDAEIDLPTGIGLPPRRALHRGVRAHRASVSFPGSPRKGECRK